MDPTVLLRGWKGLAAEVDAVRREVDPGLSLPVCANRYQLASELAFYMSGHPRVTSLNIHSRDNHYSLLPARANLYAREVLVVVALDRHGKADRRILEHIAGARMVGTAHLWQSPATAVTYGVFRGIPTPSEMQ